MQNVNEMNDLNQVYAEIDRLEYDKDNAVSMSDEDVLENQLEKLRMRRDELLQELI